MVVVCVWLSADHVALQGLTWTVRLVMNRLKCVVCGGCMHLAVTGRKALSVDRVAPQGLTWTVRQVMILKCVLYVVVVCVWL